VLTSAASACQTRWTQHQRNAIVVYNPLNIQREDIVEAKVTFPDNAAPKAVRVTPDGEAAAQISNGKVLFWLKCLSRFRGLQHRIGRCRISSGELKATEASLENRRYRIAIDKNGDVSSIFDKQISRELCRPIRLAISTDNPRQWPAGTWILKTSNERHARSSWTGENQSRRKWSRREWPSRSSATPKSPKFLQTISLSAGDSGNRVEFRNVMTGKPKQANLKATFRSRPKQPGHYKLDSAQCKDQRRRASIRSRFAQWSTDGQSGTSAPLSSLTVRTESDKPMIRLCG